MQISDGKVGSREYLAIVTFVIGLKASDITPDLLIAQGKNATWLLILFSCLYMLLPLYILLHLIKKHNTGLTDLLLGLAGKWGGSLLIAIICARLIGTTFLTSRAYIDIVNTLFFPLTPLSVLYTLLMLFSMMVAKRGFEAIARTAWIFFGIVMFVFVILLLMTWGDTEWYYLFPIAGPGLTSLLWDALTHSSNVGEVLLFAFLFPYVNSYKDFRNGTMIGYTLSGFIMIVLHAWYVAIFDYPSVEYISYPYQQMTRTASFGLTPNHLEALFLCIWIMSAVLHFAIYLYFIAFLFAKLFQIHEFEPLILPFAGLIVLLSYLPGNAIELLATGTWLVSGSSFMFLALPFLLWILDRWKGRVQ